MAEELLEALDWDSEFFGVPIARIELGGDTDETTVDAIDQEAVDRGIACVYASVDPTCAQPSHLMQERGFRLIEVAILLHRAADAPVHRPPTESVCRWGTEADLDGLDDAIRRLAPWSRYAMDPRFGLAEAERLMVAWVRRAGSADNDHHRLLVSEDESGITGFITLTMQEPALVDLAVTTRPSAGAAPALMAFAIDTVGPEMVAGPMAARNTRVGRYTSHFGYFPQRTRYIFHKWYDTGGADT